jgi:hypothetical protein
VSRLSNRQHISVSLHRSPYGGTTAVVLLPASVLTSIEQPTDERDWRSEGISAPGGNFDRPLKEAVAAWLPRAFAVPRATRRQPARDPAEPVTITGEVVAHKTLADTEQNERPTGGLPRRIRQANLAHGLRTEDAPSQRAADTDDARTSPEQARSTMTAVHLGFARGRRAHTDDAPDA